jgi:hypothetical protein
LYSTHLSIREYIIFPHHEHNTINFVDAGRLARKFGIIIIYALASSEEMDSVRTSNIANFIDVQSQI